ncbi:MAG TPA: hypothetical protein VEY50_10010 [Lysobacter sp.]|nr:hypothetical protein [Lysobacter sp.]
MKRLSWLVLALAVAAPVQAQETRAACPRLAAETGLTWEYKNAGDADLCRALRADGSEAFGLFIAKSSPFEPKGGNRVEEGTLDGRPVAWYRSELAGRPNVQARETVVELPDGRVAHIWVHANNEEQLRQALGMAQSMQFGATRLSSN